jgi:hypothetical protein
MTLGKGSIQNVSIKQKINTRSVCSCICMWFAVRWDILYIIKTTAVTSWSPKRITKYFEVFTSTAAATTAATTAIRSCYFFGEKLFIIIIIHFNYILLM